MNIIILCIYINACACNSGPTPGPPRTLNLKGKFREL